MCLVQLRERLKSQEAGSTPLSGDASAQAANGTSDPPPMGKTVPPPLEKPLPPQLRPIAAADSEGLHAILPRTHARVRAGLQLRSPLPEAATRFGDEHSALLRSRRLPVVNAEARGKPAPPAAPPAPQAPKVFSQLRAHAAAEEVPAASSWGPAAPAAPAAVPVSTTPAAPATPAAAEPQRQLCVALKPLAVRDAESLTGSERIGIVQVSAILPQPPRPTAAIPMENPYCSCKLRPSSFPREVPVNAEGVPPDWHCRRRRSFDGDVSVAGVHV